MTVTSPIIIALDNMNTEQVLAFADSIDPTLCRLKVGKELFTKAGTSIVEQLQAKNFEIFLDLKFHDIPNTTAQAVLAAADMGVWMVNVHASSGRTTMQTVKQRLQDSDYNTLVIAVTVLTSMSQADLNDIGVSDTLENQVKRLALLTKESGLDGVVCSAQEAKVLKQMCGKNFLLVTPGIRMPDDSRDDQSRICTPAKAMANGADYLVIGRSITQAGNYNSTPNDKLTQILQSLQNV